MGQAGVQALERQTDLESGVKPTKLKEKRFQGVELANILGIAIGNS